jgi:hypothetical protein
MGTAALESILKPTEFEGLHIAPADKNLVAANIELVDMDCAINWVSFTALHGLLYLPFKLPAGLLT